MTLTQFEKNYYHNEIVSSDIKGIVSDIRETFLQQYPKIIKIASKEIVPWLEGNDDLFITFRLALSDNTYTQMQEHYPEALI